MDVSMDKRQSKDYADQIKHLRARMGLRQVNLAERLGVSIPTVNRWENAKSQPSQLSWNRLLGLAGLVGNWQRELQLLFCLPWKDSQCHSTRTGTSGAR